jgi:hypothetical protein
MTNSSDILRNRTRGVLACSAVPPPAAPPPSPVCDSISLNYFKKENCFRQKVVEKSKNHILCSIIFYENRAVYEIMWKNMVEAVQASDINIMWHKRFAFWTTKATHTHTHSGYVLLNDFPWQLSLSECALVLCVHCPSCYVCLLYYI